MADRSNAGKTWTTDHLRQLSDHFASGDPPEVIAEKMGRTVSGVVSKLCEIGLLLSRVHGYHKIDPDPWVLSREVSCLEKARDEVNPQ